MKIKGNQTSHKIKEHINELYRGLENSSKPELVNEFIDFWSVEYIIKLNREKQQLNK